MKKALLMIVLSLVCATGLQAQTAPDAAELTKLLNDFLWGAGKNDSAMHDRFWAEDLIYTGSVGRRVSKADIMADLRNSPTLTAGRSQRYSAEEVRIQQYGNTAIVAFRLVSTVEHGKEIEITKFLNTGTFLKRNGKWQAVAWQATRLPRPDEASKREIGTVEAKFSQALLEANTDALEVLLDESFVWTRSTGEQFTRQQLIDDLKAGRLKYSKVENSGVTISVVGDTGIVRGVSVRERNAAPGQTSSSESFKAFYTLTLVNKAGPWKAVALHTSR